MAVVDPLELKLKRSNLTMIIWNKGGGEPRTCTRYQMGKCVCLSEVVIRTAVLTDL